MSTPTSIVIGVGAERGLGAALCRRFAAGGYHVLVAGRTPEKIARVARTIGETDGSAEPVSVDTTGEDDVVHLFDRAMSPGAGRDPADLIVFNAGNNRRIDFRELSAEQFEHSIFSGCAAGGPSRGCPRDAFWSTEGRVAIEALFGYLVGGGKRARWHAQTKRRKATPLSGTTE